MSDKTHKKKGGRPPDRSKKSSSTQKALDEAKEANVALLKEAEQLKGEPNLKIKEIMLERCHAAQMHAMENQHGLNNDGGARRKIPKLKGSPGNGYCLRVEMGLDGEDDKLEYNKILVSQ